MEVGQSDQNQELDTSELPVTRPESTKSPRTNRFQPVDGVAPLFCFMRILRGEHEGWLRNAVLVQYEGYGIVTVGLALEGEPALL